MSASDIQTRIINLLKISPLTTKELAERLGIKSTTTLRRIYLSTMESEGIIEKVAGSQRYQLKGQSLTQNQVRMTLSSNEEFYSSKFVTNYRARNTSKARERFITTFLSICKGEILTTGKNKEQKLIKIDFNCHPDSWNHPQDTERCIAALKKAFGVEKLPYNRRMVLRSALQYGMKIVLSQADSDALGISGEKPEANLGDLHITKEQLEQVLELLKDNPKMYCLFGFNYWTFCRTSTRYTVKVDDLQFYDRTVRYYETKKGNKITNAEMLQELEELGKEIKSLTHRACTLKIYENKTGSSFPKYINDERIVKALEKYCQSRKHQGFDYLFWDDNKTVFKFETYDRIVLHQKKVDNDFFMDIFSQVGFKDGDFGKSNRANYAIRHFGVQMWLMATGYDYGKIKIMGWEDINTLIIWYGQRPQHQVAKEFGEILF